MSTCHLSHFSSNLKFKQALAQYHQMIIDIYIIESFHYLRITVAAFVNVGDVLFEEALLHSGQGSRYQQMKRQR